MTFAMTVIELIDYLSEQPWNAEVVMTGRDYEGSDALFATLDTIPLDNGVGEMVNLVDDIHPDVE